jgi:hypothetical protein
MFWKLGDNVIASEARQSMIFVNFIAGAPLHKRFPLVAGTGGWIYF